MKSQMPASTMIVPAILTTANLPRASAIAVDLHLSGSACQLDMSIEELPGIEARSEVRFGARPVNCPKLIDTVFYRKVVGRPQLALDRTTAPLRRFHAVLVRLDTTRPEIRLKKQEI